MVREFIIKDILKYEINNDLSIIEELSFGNIGVILDLLQIGSKWDEDTAEDWLNNEIREHGIEKVIEDLAYDLIGRRPEDNEECINSKEIKSFSDVLESFYSQIQTVDNNLGLSEFHDMSTRYLYKYAEGIQQRYIYKKNEDLKNNYSNVVMFMSALAGKLKECPQLNEDGTIHKKSVKDKLLALKGGVR